MCQCALLLFGIGLETARRQVYVRYAKVHIAIQYFTNFFKSSSNCLTCWCSIFILVLVFSRSASSLLRFVGSLTASGLTFPVVHACSTASALMSCDKRHCCVFAFFCRRKVASNCRKSRIVTSKKTNMVVSIEYDIHTLCTSVKAY